MTLKVTKRDGRREPLQIEKIHKVLNWAQDGLSRVSISDVELKARIQFYDGMPTADIHQMLIRSAADLISEQQPDYQFLAARLAIFALRKQAYGGFTPPPLLAHIRRLVGLGKYDALLLSAYSEEDIQALDKELNHDRDLQLAYAAVRQLQGKYLLQDRVSGQLYESPQFVYLLIGMCLFADYPATNRLDYVRRFYQAASQHRFSLPTPIMAGVRTPTRQFSSCVLIETDDTLNSVNATTASIVQYVSQRAGIGINAGRLRAIGSPIRGGEAFHTGCIPFYKLFQAAVKSCSQGGIRGGAATLFYPLWHGEVESLLVLKNNRGIEENRCRHLDYGVQLNRLMYQRLIEDGLISLFSPSDVPGLYDAFFADQREFERLYRRYEDDPAVVRKSVPARELFGLLLQERASTGRIYIQHVDHCNDYGPFDPAKAPIRQSNLCMEIALPTKPLQAFDDEEGEIALCTLAAVNVGQVHTAADLNDVADILVRALDALLDYQRYPVTAAQRSTQKRRPLGIGVINFAYFLAQRGLKYGDAEALHETHRLFEQLQFSLLTASNRLAQERGACPAFGDTKYAAGAMPADRYKPELDDICTTPLQCDWASLSENIVRFGLRNSTLTAQMPAETSAQIANATNGIEPVRALVTTKASKDGILKQVVPEIERLGAHYDLLWQQPDNNGYLQLVAVMQKFIDQSISANTSYQPERYPQRKVPMQLLIGDLLRAYKLGVKTLYYHNTRDGAQANHNAVEQAQCESGACAI